MRVLQYMENVVPSPLAWNNNEPEIYFPVLGLRVNEMRYHYDGISHYIQHLALLGARISNS